VPAVPSPSVPSVAPSGQAQPYQSAAGASPEAFGAGIGLAESHLGAGIENLGNVLEKHALKMQEDVNVSHAEELFLHGDTQLSTLTETYTSLQGAARVNALPKFMEDAAKIREEVKAQAPNPDVAKKFDQLFTRQLGYSIKDAGRLAGTANRQYQKETSNAVVANSMSNIAKNADDDQRFLASTQNALTSQRNLPEYQGASDETKLQMDRAIVDGAWGTRLQAMAKDNPLRARELLNKNKASLSGETELKIKPIIDQEIIRRDTKVQSDQIINDVGIGTMEERVKRLEGYTEKASWDYKQMSSGYGTRSQPGDENIPPDQRKAVYTQRLRNELGKAYQIVDNFAPGLPKGARDALADLTFNAGEKWTQEGLGQAVRAGDLERAKSILPMYNNVTEPSGVKHPLQNLTERRAEELRWWNTDTGSAIDTAGLTSKALDKAKERSIQVFPDEPANQAAYLDTLQQRIVGDTRIMQNAARDSQHQVRNVVMNELIDDKKNITTVDQMSDAAQAAYNSAPQGLRGIFDARMRKNMSADVPPSNAGAKRFLQISGMASYDPEGYADLNIDNEPLLTRGQKQTLTLQQQQTAANVKRGIAVDGAMKSMHPFLNDAGISDSATDKGRRDGYLQFRGAFEAAINAEMAEKKRKLTPKETTDIGQGLLKEEVTDPGWIGGWVPFTSTRQRPYQFEVRKGSEEADFAKIPAGAVFKHPNGSYRIKPGIRSVEDQSGG